MEQKTLRLSPAAPPVDYPLEWEGRKMLRQDESVKYIVVHCSATRCNEEYTEQQMEQDHRARGFTRIGYHFYIRRDGRMIHPRLLGEVGAHALGYNHCSLGICYEGGLDAAGRAADTRTEAQKQRLLDTILILKRIYPKATVLGHYQLNSTINKSCPCFDAKRAYRDL